MRLRSLRSSSHLRKHLHTNSSLAELPGPVIEADFPRCRSRNNGFPASVVRPLTQKQKREERSRRTPLKPVNAIKSRRPSGVMERSSSSEARNLSSRKGRVDEFPGREYISLRKLRRNLSNFDSRSKPSLHCSTHHRFQSSPHSTPFPIRPTSFRSIPGPNSIYFDSHEHHKPKKSLDSLELVARKLI